MRYFLKEINLPRLSLLFFCFLAFFLPFAVMATSQHDLQRGDQLAVELLGRVDANKREAGGHPFYRGVPSESSLTHAELGGRAQTLRRNDPASQMVLESSERRPQFNIDPQRDPILLRSQEVMETPLRSIGGESTRIVRTEHRGTDETFACEEAGEDSLERCTHELNVRVVRTKVRREWRGVFQLSKCSNSDRGGHYLPCTALRNAFYLARRVLAGRNFSLGRQPPVDSSTVLNITVPYKACITELAARRRNCRECNAYLPALAFPTDQIKEVSFERHPQRPQKLHMNYDHFHVYNSGRTEYNFQPRIKIVYEEDSYEVLPDQWISNCDRLEARVDQGLCAYDSKVCTQGPQTRTIQGVPVTKDCWQYTHTYSCSYPAANDCGPLRARQCTQASSTCKQTVGSTCVVYTQTYSCRGNTTPAATESIVGGQTPFCLDGSCREQSGEVNDEMMSTLAQLSLLKEMQGQIARGTIFRGEDSRCSKCILSFKDCCGSGKGWGRSIGLTDCSARERLLRDKRNAGLCHYVGTYCDERIPIIGTCIKKKSTYCCFNSKLLKAFHEQGRPQIRLGWGSAEEPICRGFTVEELQRIDFSRLDLREVYEDLIRNFRRGKDQNLGQRIGERINTIKDGLAPKTRPQPRQRDGA